MSTTTYFFVFGAILLPVILYISYAFREMKNIASISDFYPLKRTLNTGAYRSTTVAAGMSLATVIIAIINLAPSLGITLFVPVFSYALSFLVLYACAPRIMMANPSNDTIQAYLGKIYESSNVKYVALLFTLIGYMSIFSMELLVGVTVLSPFLGESVLIFSLLYLIFILAYASMSGYRAIVATDRWQLRFILVSLFAIVILAIADSVRIEAVNPAVIFSSVSQSWIYVWPFIIGIIIMNVPFPISDAGTWQRLCSTRDVATAQRGLLQIAPLFAIIWTVIVLFGCYYWHIAALEGFDPTQKNLITHVMEVLATSGLFYKVLLFLFVLGLFSAMISTADSFLIAAGQLLSIDVMKLNTDRHSPKETMRRARLVVGLIGILSFVLFVTLHFLEFDVVQLVFAIYGAQLALFPAVFFSLFFKKYIDLKKARLAAISSIFVGFGSSWASALYGKLGEDLNWLYYAPVTAFVSSLTVFLILATPAFIVKRLQKS